MANICEKCIHRNVCRYQDPCEECNQFAEEVVHAKWITTYTVDTWMGTSKIDGFVCGECGKSSKVGGNYCPNCGAKMDGDGNEC